MLAGDVHQTGAHSPARGRPVPRGHLSLSRLTLRGRLPLSGQDSSLMYVDPRGLRFGAVVTTLVLAVGLVTASAWVLLAQTLVFAVGAAAGLRRAPYGLLFRALVRPRLGPPRELEAEAPPRFAQAVGF